MHTCAELIERTSALESGDSKRTRCESPKRQVSHGLFDASFPAHAVSALARS
jgi:hypothetical protein